MSPKRILPSVSYTEICSTRSSTRKHNILETLKQHDLPYIVDLLIISGFDDIINGNCDHILANHEEMIRYVRVRNRSTRVTISLLPERFSGSSDAWGGLQDQPPVD